jgi:hypothetical protein
MNKTKNSLRLLIFLLITYHLSLITASYAATYYIDQTAGNDSYNGSQATPWKNCPGMSLYSGSGQLNPGDVVYFDRADTWLMTGGTQGLYLVGGVSYIGDSWGTGTRATIRTNVNFVDNAVIRFRDHATYMTVFQGFDVDGNHKVTSGIDINHGFCSLMNGAMKRVKNCIVHNTYSEQNSGQYKYGIIISNFCGTGGYAENVEILDTVVHDISRDGICLYPSDQSSSCRIKNITVRGCEVYNTGQDPGYSAGSGIVAKGYVQDAFIEYNYVHDTKAACIFMNSNETRHYGVGLTNIHVRYNACVNSTIHGAIRVYHGASGGDPFDIKIYGNLVYNSVTNGGFVISTDLKDTINLVVDNNTFYNAPVIIDNNGATFNTFEFKNNIIYYSGGTPLTDAGPYIKSHGNNLFYRTGGGNLVLSGSNNYSAANLAGYESSASAADPLFINASNLPTGFTGTYGSDLKPNAGGLALQPNSPAKDAGAALLSAYSGSINSQSRPAGSGWDIGAYEFVPSGSDTTPPANIAAVNDGTGSDLDYTAPAIQLSANWTASSDAETGISGYKYAIGTTAGSSNVTNWTALGNVLTVTRTGLSLTAGTTYYFSVKAVNGSGLESAAANSDGICVISAGGGGGDLIPPAISRINISNVTPAGATVTWNTDEAATSCVLYGISLNYTGTTGEDANLTTSHSVQLAGLSGQTQYHCKIISRDGSGNQGESADHAFITLAAGGGDTGAKVYPNPYRLSGTSNMTFSLDSGPGEVRIYSLSGKLVKKLALSGGSDAVWNMTNESGNRINGGLYIYIMSDSVGSKKTGKIVVTN